jgi:hypothetical protein
MLALNRTTWNAPIAVLTATVPPTFAALCGVATGLAPEYAPTIVPLNPVQLLLFVPISLVTIGLMVLASLDLMNRYSIPIIPQRILVPALTMMPLAYAAALLVSAEMRSYPPVFL